MATATMEAPQTQERRRAARRQPAQGTTYTLPTAGGLGLVWNISESGVSMLLPAPLEAGTRIDGTLVAADGTTTLPTPVRVAHVKQIQTGDYFLGAQFAAPLTAEQLRPFLGPALREGGPDAML